MDERDDWLEGVRRWYFGGEAPADEAESDLAWPSATPAAKGSEVLKSSVAPPTSPLPSTRHAPAHAG